MSEHLERIEDVLTYDWLKRASEPPLIPLTILIQARYKNKHITWCRAQFTDYQLFTSRVKIVANGYVQSLQP